MKGKSMLFEKVKVKRCPNPQKSFWAHKSISSADCQMHPGIQVLNFKQLNSTHVCRYVGTDTQILSSLVAENHFPSSMLCSKLVNFRKYLKQVLTTKSFPNIFEMDDSETSEKWLEMNQGSSCGKERNESFLQCTVVCYDWTGTLTLGV